jgi:hypothetical protein
MEDESALEIPPAPLEEPEKKREMRIEILALHPMRWVLIRFLI